MSLLHHIKTGMKFKNNASLLGCVIAALYGLPAITVAQEVDFDPIFLNSMAGGYIDVAKFNGEYSIPPGTYDADIYLNDSYLSRETIKVKDKDNKSVVCFSSSLIALTGFKTSLLPPESQEMLLQGKECIPLETLDNASSAKFLFSDMRLNIHIPQAHLHNLARGYVDPVLWENGTNALYVSYDNNYFRQEAGKAVSESFYSKLNGGINLNGWLFQHSGNWAWNSTDTQGNYTVYSNNLQRDITSLKSRLLLGDTVSPGNLFDSFSFRGVQLATAEQMLPDSQRGYAPIVRGIAQTNARVTVRQNQSLIYETTVPPGEFMLNDIYPSGYGGDLNVTVTESDGQETSFSVPYTAISEMLRPGSYRYSMLLGELRNQGVNYSPEVYQATIQYGINNWLTGYSGLTGTKNYYAGLIGGAVSTTIGAFALDITGARFDAGVSSQRGLSIRAGYTKLITATNSSISLSAYRFSSSGYLSLANAVSLSEKYIQDRNAKVQLNGQPQQRISLTLNQPLGNESGNFYASGYMERYWDRTGNDVQYQLGYSNNFHSLNYGISVNRAKTNGRTERQYMLSLSMPLGTGSSTPHVNSYSVRDANGISSQLGVSGNLGMHEQFGYSLGFTRENKGNTTQNLSGSYRFKQTQLRSGYTQGQGFRSYTAGMSGSVVVLPDTWLTSAYTGETMGIVEAKGASGASIEGYSNVVINDDGYALVPYLLPYRINKVGINPEGMPLDVELETTVKQTVPRAGAIVKINYPTKRGRVVLIHAQLPDGEELPFGASVQTKEGQEVGVVAQGGQIYVRLDEKISHLQVRWGAESQHVCAFDVTLPDNNKLRQMKFQRLDTVCQ
ncbi:fimbria/pilus outer membrane usher protein [Mixta intestinalis]|uniref:Outer membrane usher protein HtrE n=1 Tax=Mixta intestinalis TaxID=1615494 RepID=A0A6P1Q2L7_9GAMM|nr:fimbria/pilus outer membrane usher protein [Mixta intestinalis]QHM73156.1 Outer membrane usher protein HtrE [Mixta intestinalis]